MVNYLSRYGQVYHGYVGIAISKSILQAFQGYIQPIWPSILYLKGNEKIKWNMIEYVISKIVTS